MYSSQSLSSIASVLPFLLLPLLVNAHTCTKGFLREVNKINITQNCSLKTLRAEFAWNFNNMSRQLEIAFGTRLDTETGWLAWGLNPDGPHMVGTRALIGIRHQDSSLEGNMYNITSSTKRGCQLLPDEDIGLNVRKFSFEYLEKIDYYMIRATIFLPKEYNSSCTNVVWQIGEASVGRMPFMHPKTLKNFDSAETINLISHQVISYKAHPRGRIRSAHGILNIVGWGTFLPVGVIVARYFKRFPTKWPWWFVVHVSCQGTGYILGTIGWGIGLWLGDQSKYYGFSTHRILGIFIFTFTIIQMMALTLKPKYSDEYRTYWNMYHHFLGYALLALISVNIFEGTKILEPKRDNAWRWVYIGLVGALGGIALVLELYTWFKFLGKKYGICQNERKSSSSNQNAAQPSAVQPSPSPAEPPQPDI